MDDPLSINQMITGLVSSAMGYTALVVVLVIVTRWVRAALSLALVPVLRSASEDTQRVIIKFLVHKGLTVRELYEEIKAEEQAGHSS